VDAVVIGIDSSTQSTKAIAWNAKGNALAEGRGPIGLSNPALGHFEQDPAEWWRSTVTALSEVMRTVDKRAVQGVAISNQRETQGFFAADGTSVRPATLWLDERARREVKEFPKKVGGAERVHAITGRHPDLTPGLYRLAWMQRHEPEVFARVDCVADVQAALVQRLCGGGFRTSWSSADPSGLFDLRAKTWSAEILDALELDRSRLPETHPPATELGRVTADAAAVTGLAEGTPVYAGGGDGQVAGLGTNCTSPDRAYINLGTAVVSGVWSPDYHYGHAWRTEIAAQGTGYILENCLRSGAFLVNWFVDQFVPGGRTPEVWAKLEADALALPIGSEGVMVQPYWSGCMDPHWDIDARGVILGLSGSHKPAHVYRAILEGITLDQVMRTRATEAAMGHEVAHYVAIGGGASSPLWRQMLADASGKPVLLSPTVEASALGAGMLAAAGAGLYGSIEEAAREMSGATRQIDPDPSTASRWSELLDIYHGIFQATASANHRLVAFAAGDPT
jgi:xylulokinase